MTGQLLRPLLVAAVALMLATPADAQFRRAQDTTLPIEIAADSLEVQQDDQIAVFSGNVDAQQGEMKLRADKLFVHYHEGSGNEAAQAISKIDAEGEVFFSSGSETAAGNAGTYDVDKGVIVLTGQVVLTQGENVIKGNRVVLDLKSGLSTMDSAPSEGGGRVRGLFVPRGNQNR